MQIEHTKLPGVVIITPARFGDSRGFFSESWSASRMADAGAEQRIRAIGCHRILCSYRAKAT